jgi:hypothetical protein
MLVSHPGRFTPEKESLVPSGHEALGPRAGLDAVEREKSLAHARNRTPIPPSRLFYLRFEVNIVLS